MAMQFVRITVGDAHVCDDCITFEDIAPMTLDEWDESGYKPRVAPTACDGKCRCGLVPATESELKQRTEEIIDEVVEESIGNVKIDLTTGRTVILKDFEAIEGMLTAQYARIAEMEQLIYEWKVANDGAKLPDDFFQLQDVELMVDWLKKAPAGASGQPSVPPAKSVKEKPIRPEDMTPEQDAVSAYTGSGYADINNILRKGGVSEEGIRNLKSLDINPKDWVEYHRELADKISSYLKKQPKFTGTTYRDIGFNNETEFKTFVKTLESTGGFTDKGFFSTTKRKIISGYGKGKYKVRFEVKGKNGVDVKNVSRNPGDEEILYDKNTTFKVKKVIKRDDFLQLEFTGEKFPGAEYTYSIEEL